MHWAHGIPLLIRSGNVSVQANMVLIGELTLHIRVSRKSGARREYRVQLPSHRADIVTAFSIQTIALLLSEPRQKPSLVVAPVVALMQWKNEIETHAEGFTVSGSRTQSRGPMGSLINLAA